MTQETEHFALWRDFVTTTWALEQIALEHSHSAASENYSVLTAHCRSGSETQVFLKY